LSTVGSRREGGSLPRFEELWRDEHASAALYRDLAAATDDQRLRDLFAELAVTEERHAAHWAERLAAAGRPLPGLGHRPLSHRLLVWRARRFGVERVVPAVIRGEAADRDRYRDLPQAAPGMAEEEAGHGRRLALAVSDDVGAALALADARHRTHLGGGLRAAVFGINDGLVSNLALIMGVAGGTGNPDAIVLAGVAGLVAGAGSMAAGEWISVRSQRELYEREIEVERWELEAFPDDERDELELIYRSKGLDEEAAREVADRIMRDPEVALDTLAREELGLNPGDLDSPWVAAGSSLVAFATGAVVPLVPFLVATGTRALVAAAVLSAIALALVGVTLSTFTGRGAARSAARMVAIGAGTALITFGIGSALGVSID
jgi:vacuolar iron transporter family protein